MHEHNVYFTIRTIDYDDPATVESSIASVFKNLTLKSPESDDIAEEDFYRYCLVQIDGRKLALSVAYSSMRKVDKDNAIAQIYKLTAKILDLIYDAGFEKKNNVESLLATLEEFEGGY